jgi:phenolic acid decarboxylase
MTTLFQRLGKINLPAHQEVVVLSDQKIGMHAFTAAITEFFYDEFTGADVKAMFNLDDGQTIDAIRIKSLIQDAPDKVAFMRNFKNVLYLTEGKYAYIVEAEFWTRAEGIVLQQGGTIS